MSRLETRLAKLESRSSAPLEYVLEVRTGERIADAIARYESEGRRLAPSIVIGGEAMTVEQWVSWVSKGGHYEPII